MIFRRRHAMALALAAVLTSACGIAQAQTGIAIPQRWHPGDAPPEIAGIALGDSLTRVVAVLGQPDPDPVPEGPAADQRILRYHDGALLVLLSKTTGVSRVLLNRAEGGELAGIRVGDRLGPLLLSWGEPTFSTSTVGRYDMGSWRISVRADLAAQKVLRLMLARTAPQTTPPPPPPATDPVPSAAN